MLANNLSDYNFPYILLFIHRAVIHADGETTHKRDLFHFAKLFGMDLCRKTK